MNPAGTPLIERCPRLVRVAGHPVYVAPELALNCFFAEGCYWLLPDDGTWRRSTGFDGPWARIEPDAVPYVLLRLPFGAYRRPPPGLLGGAPFRPPHWARIWGEAWARRHPGWHTRAPGLPETPAPRPPAQQARELLRAAARSPLTQAPFFTPQAPP